MTEHSYSFCPPLRTRAGTKPLCCSIVFILDFLARMRAVWFCRRFWTSGCDVTVPIVEPQVWPEELNELVAARTLRGSVAAEELRKLLSASPIVCMPEVGGEPASDLGQAEAGNLPSDAISREGYTGPLRESQARRWKRRLLRLIERILTSLKSAFGQE